MPRIKTKWCPKHGHTPITEFFKNRRNPDGLQTYCKTCCHERTLRWQHNNKDKVAAMSKRWRQNNRDRVRERERVYHQSHRVRRNLQSTLSRYRMKAEEYKRLLERSGGKCEICGKPFTKTPHVDHCHESKRVRGLLCGRCNTGLGQLQHNSEVLKNAIRYLKMCAV